MWKIGVILTELCRYIVIIVDGVLNWYDNTQKYFK